MLNTMQKSITEIRQRQRRCAMWNVLLLLILKHFFYGGNRISFFYSTEFFDGKSIEVETMQAKYFFHHHKAEFICFFSPNHKIRKWF